MSVIESVGALGWLLGSLAVGICVHETLHAVFLRAIGVACRIEFLPSRTAGGVGVGLLGGAWARVTLSEISTTTSVRGLKLAALSPILMLTPFAFVALGMAPDPMTQDDLPLKLATIGWFATALPSAQDFVMFWQASDLRGYTEARQGEWFTTS
ncbi:hypothetical protein [Haladaptatus sp. NG-SE-30]